VRINTFRSIQFKKTKRTQKGDRLWNEETTTIYIDHLVADETKPTLKKLIVMQKLLMMKPAPNKLGSWNELQNQQHLLPHQQLNRLQQHIYRLSD
jgi:hypothetical protein